MPNPIKPIVNGAKAVQGAVRGVQLASNTAKANKQSAKAGMPVMNANGTPGATKLTVGNAARGMAFGAQNPKDVKDMNNSVKAMLPAKNAKKG